MKKPFLPFFASFLAFSSLASAAPGTLHTYTMIADSTGGFGTLQNGDRLGSSVASIGDLDGDGISDLVSGAHRDDTGGTDRGAVYILFLKADGTVKSKVKIADNTSGFSSLTDGDRFGTSCAALGDVDGDGVLDIAVSATFDDTGGADRGAVYILFLNKNGTVKSQTKIADNTNGFGSLVDGDHLGASCAGVGDLDGDGVPELAVCAGSDNTGGTDRGALYLLYLNADGSVKSQTKIASDTNGGPTLVDGDIFGASCATLGDLDHDGVPELAVGAQFDDTGGDARGSVYVLFLNAGGTVKSYTKLASDLNGFATLPDSAWFGSSCTSLGDLDGDNIPELGVGAEFQENRGVFHILFLNADGSVKSSTSVNSGVGGFPTISALDYFGCSCALLGDVNGDGIPECAVGARADDTGGNERGAAYLLSLGDLPITVTTLADEFDTPSGADISLREAVRDAGTAGEYRTINFHSSLNGGTIRLTSTSEADANPDIDLKDLELKITGAGLPDGIAISGEDATKIFFVWSTSTVTLECLTLERGNVALSGPAVQGDPGSITVLKDVTVQDCYCGANGGAIFSQGSLFMERCLIARNETATQAGGIYTGGSFVAINCTFDNNTVTSGTGGALTAFGSDALIRYCTFTENSAPGGTGGALLGNANTSLEYSLFSGNTADTSPDFGGALTDTDNVIVPLDELAALGNYGGKTLTRPLLPTSSSKNVSTFLPQPATDQRGFPRSRNGGTDPGAAEAIETTDYQPDNHIGEKSGKQKGNNIYNTSGAGQNVTAKLQGTKKFKTFMTVQNDGVIPDTITLRSNKPNKRTLKLKVIQLGGGNVTAALLRGLTLPDLESGESVAFKADYKRKSRTKKAKGKINFTSTSSLFGKSDTVQAKVKSLRE